MKTINLLKTTKKTRIAAMMITSLCFVFVFQFAGLTGPTELFGYGSGGGGGSSPLRVDSCPSGDNSPSYYDGTCSGAPTLSIVSTPTDNKQNVTFTSDIDSIVDLNGSISKEKLDIFVRGIRDRVYTRTSGNAERIISLSAMSRYVNKQAELATDPKNKAVLGTLEARLNDMIANLRQDIFNSIAVIPNNKKNDTSDEVTVSTFEGAHMYRYVNTEAPLAVRSERNFQAGIRGYLLANQRIEIVAMGPNWSQVKSDNIEGYVRTRLLRKTLEMRNRLPVAYGSNVSVN